MQIPLGLFVSGTAFVAGVGTTIALGGAGVQQVSGTPICPFDSPQNCQSYNDWAYAILSDECVGDTCLDRNPATTVRVRVADDFVASVTGDVTSVCVSGMYLRTNTLDDCILDEIDQFTATNLPGPFIVTIYTDDGGIPGVPIVPRQFTNTTAADIEYPASQEGHDIWRIALALDTPIPLTAGNTYWLEVVANTDGLDDFGYPSRTDSLCDWYWANSDSTDSAQGNGLSYQNAGDIYDVQDVTPGVDFAWCIDVPNDVPPTPQRACCTCDGTCAVLTADACINAVQGNWIIDQHDCGGFVCPIDPPANDACSGAIELTADVPYSWSNTCATDSPAPLDEVDCGGTTPTPFMRDIWFTWFASDPCRSGAWTGDYRFSTYSPDPRAIDMVLEVYTDGTPNCVCPSDSTYRVACNDDVDLIVGTGSEIVFPVYDGVCYTIRVGSDTGEMGGGMVLIERGTVSVSQPAPPIPGGDGPGNRYIPFQLNPFCVTPGVGSAIRAKFVSLDGYPEPDYLWVGEPYDAPYEDASNPGRTFRVAPLVCEPFYHEWGNEGDVHIYGAEIIPGSDYELQRVLVTCVDLSDEACYSPPLAVTTPKFGDVAPPFADPANPQPDFHDLAAMVGSFLAEAGAPDKAHAQLQPNVVYPDRSVDFRDIATDVQAFLGVAHSGLFFGPCTCPSSVTCGATPCGSDLQCAGVTPDGGLCIDAFCTDPCGRCAP